VCQRCLAGCCPHERGDSAALTAECDRAGPGCPADVPGAAMPERVGHLYSCQGLSTYRIAGVVGLSRQVVTRILHRAGVPVKSRGSGRRRAPSGPGAGVADEVLADMYLRRRLTSAQISGLTRIPARTIQDRLHAQGIQLRTRGRFNREDRIAVEPHVLAQMYVHAGLPAGEVGEVLGVSRKIVLRSAHDQGLPVRVGGPAPVHGPAEIELINALYADTQVRRTMARHGLPRVPPGGALWQRFPVPLRVTGDLAAELYVSCGLGLTHIELLTGQPAASIGRMLRSTGAALRPPGGRSPFLRRWRASSP
jgi:hypothetical protein